MTTGGSRDWLYTPDSAPQDAWRPAVTSVTYDSSTTTYTLTGTQLSGLINGGDEGDDMTMAENYPIVWLKDGSNNVYYCRSSNFSTMGPQVGTAPQTCQFTTPANLPGGSYSLFVSSVGVQSKSAFPFTVGVGGTATGGASGTGGTPGTGGAVGGGGAPGTGGVVGTGGAPATGGQGGAAGKPGTGGTPASGGTTGSGGAATGSGGTTGTSGQGGSGRGGSAAGGAGETGAGGDTTSATSGCSCATSPESPAAFGGSLGLAAAALALARRRRARR